MIMLDTLNTNDENNNVLTVILGDVVASTESRVNCIIVTVIPEKNAAMSPVFCIICDASFLSFDATLGISGFKLLKRRDIKKK